MANTVIGASVEVEFNSVGNLRKAIKEATSDLIAMQEKFGMSSKEAVAAASKVAELKDRIKDAREQSDLFDPGKKFQAFVNIGSTIAGGFAAVQGAMALVGAESENVQKAMMKVQAAMALAQGLSQLKEFGKAWDGLKGFISKATTGLSSFQKVMAGLGVGILIAIVAAWDDIAQALGFAKKQSEDYTAVQKAGNDALADARAKVTEVGVAFKLAEKDVNLKEQALKTYNEKLGDSIGKANTLEEAEALYRANTGAYVASVKARAIAQEAFSRGAKLMVDYEQSLSNLGVTSQEVDDYLKKTGKTAEEFVAQNFTAATSLTGLLQGGANEKDLKIAQAIVLKSKEDEANQLNTIAENALIEANTQESKFQTERDRRNKKHTETRVNTAKQGNDKETKLAQQKEEALRIIQETSFKLMSDEQAELEKLRLKNLEDQKKLEVAGFAEGSEQRIALQQAYDKERTAITDKYEKERIAKEREFQDQINAIELETRMAGITNVREKELAELANTYQQKNKEIDRQENISEEERGKLRAALLTQQNQAEAQLREKFRQEDLQTKSAKLKETADDEENAFQIRLTALQDRLNLVNQITFASEDERLKFIKENEEAIAQLQSDTQKARIENLFKEIDAWYNAAQQIGNVLRQSNRDQITKLEEQSAMRIKAAGDDKDAVLAIERETAAAKVDLQNKQIKRDKMMAIVEATINTFKAASQVFASGSNFTLSMKIAAMVAAIAQGLANVASIKKVKLPAGDVSGGNMPGTTTSPLAPGISPSVQGQALNAEAINNLGNQAIRAYVMNSDIQNNQQQNAYLQRNARLG